MPRGRKPKEAIRSALRIAEKRGEVDQVRFRPGMICTFIIYCAGLVAHVRVKRMRHIRCPEQTLEREAADELAALRIIASLPKISRELWICSPKGNFRFFRVMDDSPVELDRDGQPLPVQWPVRTQRKVQPVPVPAEDIREEMAPAGESGGCAQGDAVPEPVPEPVREAAPAGAAGNPADAPAGRWSHPENTPSGT